MCSGQQVDLAALRRTAGEVLGTEIREVVRIGGGRNSQVYRLERESGGRLALKLYFRQALDKRDRLGTEFHSFEFLWNQGFRQIPRPLVIRPDERWAVYEFIEGDKVPPGHATAEHVRQVTDFLCSLKPLARLPESQHLSLASEACFTVKGIVDSVTRRLEALQALPANDAPHAEMKQFLDSEYIPAMIEILDWSKAHLIENGEEFAGELARERRTLSPSDYGFHNALLRQDGRMIFLDFEYFGWDDPSKMIADFLLHPAMEMSAVLKRTFATAMFRHFSDLRGRVESVYPIFGLKWCMILLNEFLPESLQRRQFAAIERTDSSDVQRQQLEKARRMLDRIRREYQCFPYRD